MPRNDLIQLRSDTAANWVSVNPTLAVGETGFETDTGKLKVGTGSTAWNSLLYVTDASDLAGIIPSARISGSYTGITGVGTLTAGTWNSSLIAGQYGGTGVANTGKTITLGGNLTTSGAFTTTLTATANTSLTLPSSGTVISTANLSSITSVGTLTGLALSGTVTLPNSVNNQIYTSTTADSALPWCNGPVLQGATGWSFYSAVSSSYRMGFRSGTTGATKYFWTADSALIGAAPNDAEVTNTLNVMGTGRFTSTVTAPTFSGALSGNATTSTKAGSLGASGVSGTAMTFHWSGQGGQPNWLWGGNDGSNMYVYNPSNFSVNYANSSGTAGYASTVGSGSGGIPYPGATIGGGSPNNIGFRWTNPYVNCTVDNVISAEAANFSDRRLKTNINAYTDGLNAVRNLRPVTFNPLDIMSFTDDGEPIVGDNDPYDEMLGFIADEVQEIIPSAISGTGTRLKSVSVLQIVSVAVSAIKELDATVQSLTERIKQLEESNV